MGADAPPAVAAVVISAPRLPPSPADAAFSIVRVAPEIVRTAPRLDDALEQVPGFSLYRRLSSAGANPTTEGVSLRGIAGSAASRALVTLDGVPQNDPFGGWVIFNSLPVETIGAVTIVRGAGAGPYGAGALTGVVDLESAAVAPGDWLVDARGGTLGQARASGVGAVQTGPITATFAASAEHSDGWDPIRAGRGPADDDLTLTDESASARFAGEVGRATAAFRVSVFDEVQGAGLAGAGSRDHGGSASFTAAAQPTADALGWRAQAWLLASNLANRSVSVSANQAETTAADDEYATPALGVGANTAVRKAWTHATLELGLDVRQDAGEDRETFDAVDGTLTMNRRAGGDQIVGGVYLEATREIGRLLLSAGARADVWRTFEGHDDQGPIGAPPSETVDTGDRGGVTPSGRFAARWNLDDGGWLRGAAYSGFRPPTLNELFRPYRVANTVTLNNTALVPERLYGVEAGAGQDAARFGWSATAFYNRLDDPVTNVTLHDGPYDDPLAGYVPAGGFLLERENVGAVDALGLEFDGHVTLFRGWALRGAVSWTHSRVDGGEAAPQLTGLRPAETPAVAATASLDAPLARNVTLVVDARYEGRRFVDDLNTLALAGSAVANARVDWRVSRRVTLYLEAENLFDAEIEQDEATAGLFSYGPPRAVLVGLRLTGDDVARSSASATP